MDTHASALKHELSLLDEDATMSADRMDAVFAGLAADTVDKKPSLRDRLRELSTPVRVALGVSGALVMVAVMSLTMGVRPGLGGEALLRYALVVTSIAGLVAASFSVSLRGLHQRQLGATGWVIISLALLVPLALALIPEIWSTGAPMAMMAGDGMDMCLPLGLATGALTTAVAWVFQRQDFPLIYRLLAAAGGGGLTAFAMLQLHCPATDPTHLLVTHAGVGLVLAAVVALVVVIRQRGAQA